MILCYTAGPFGRLARCLPWLALALLTAMPVTGCIRVPGGNLASVFGGQASHSDKPTDEATKKLRNELDITEFPVYLRNPDAGLFVYTSSDYTTAVSAASAGFTGRDLPGRVPTPLSSANVVCVGMSLRDWEAGQNNFEGSAAWQVLYSWLSAKRALGIRIDCTSRDDLPNWMAARVPLMEGVPGQPPLFWDADYVGHHKALVSWLASKLETNGADRLQLVVITGADWDSPIDFAKADPSFTTAQHAALVRELVEHYSSVFTAKDTSGKPKFRFAQLYISRRAVERAGAAGRRTGEPAAVPEGARSRRGSGRRADRQHRPVARLGPRLSPDARRGLRQTPGRGGREYRSRGPQSGRPT